MSRLASAEIPGAESTILLRFIAGGVIGAVAVAAWLLILDARDAGKPDHWGLELVVADGLAATLFVDWLAFAQARRIVNGARGAAVRAIIGGIIPFGVLAASVVWPFVEGRDHGRLLRAQDVHFALFWIIPALAPALAILWAYRRARRKTFRRRPEEFSK